MGRVVFSKGERISHLVEQTLAARGGPLLEHQYDISKVKVW